MEIKDENCGERLQIPYHHQISSNPRTVQTRQFASEAGMICIFSSCFLAQDFCNALVRRLNRQSWKGLMVGVLHCNCTGHILSCIFMHSFLVLSDCVLGTQSLEFSICMHHAAYYIPNFLFIPQCWAFSQLFCCIYSALWFMDNIYHLCKIGPPFLSLLWPSCEKHVLTTTMGLPMLPSLVSRGGRDGRPEKTGKASQCSLEGQNKMNTCIIIKRDLLGLEHQHQVQESPPWLSVVSEAEKSRMAI